MLQRWPAAEHRGNIELAAVAPVRVEADFRAGAEGVKMRLKARLGRSIQTDVARAVEEHGNLTPAYLVRVRELALRYWLEWSRHELFEMAPL